MKKFLISMLAVFFVFATVHAQSDSSSTGTMRTHKTTKSGSSTHAKAHHKTMHHHHKSTASKKSTTSGGAKTTTTQQPVAASKATPSTSAKTIAKATKTSAKGAHYAVNNGKKTYVKAARSNS